MNTNELHFIKKTWFPPKALTMQLQIPYRILQQLLILVLLTHVSMSTAQVSVKQEGYIAKILPSSPNRTQVNYVRLNGLFDLGLRHGKIVDHKGQISSTEDFLKVGRIGLSQRYMLSLKSGKMFRCIPQTNCRTATGEKIVFEDGLIQSNTQPVVDGSFSGEIALLGRDDPIGDSIFARPDGEYAFSEKPPIWEWIYVEKSTKKFSCSREMNTKCQLKSMSFIGHSIDGKSAYLSSSGTILRIDRATGDYDLKSNVIRLTLNQLIGIKEQSEPNKGDFLQIEKALLSLKK
jgi:hypothetical protein